MEYILTTDRLCRTFGKGRSLNRAVDDVSLHIQQGQIYGLIGRNGAGKTTILKMVGGMIRPTSGTISLMGAPLVASAKNDSLCRVGTLIEAPGIQNGMSGFDNLKLKCICAGIGGNDDYIRGLLQTVGLSAAADKKAGHYSLGMKQRLGIALALVGEPEMLILDEPINGLDPQGIAEVREMLLSLNRERGITILISSHILEEMSRLVTNYGIIERGKLIREFDRADLERECARRVTLRTSEPDAALRALSEIGITNAEISAPGTVLIYEKMDQTPEFVRALTERGIPVSEIFHDGQSLEDFFFHLVGGARHA